MKIPDSWTGGINLRHLTYFLAAAETGNFSRAAVRIGRTQPAVSKQITDLEGLLGVELFRRSRGQSARLTKAGAAFFKDVAPIVSRLDDSVDGLRRAFSHDELLEIGFAESPTAEIMDAISGGLTASKLRFRMHNVSVGECVEQIRLGRMDMALTVRPLTPPKKILFRPLVTYRLLCAVSAEHPTLAGKSSISLQELNQQRLLIFSRKQTPQYLADIHRLFEGLDFRPNFAEEFEEPADLLRAVRENYGMALLLESAKRMRFSKIDWLRIQPEPGLTDVGVVHKNGLSKRLKAVIDVMESATCAFRDSTRRNTGRHSRNPTR